METDVTDWYLVADWDARPEAADEVAVRLRATSEAIKDALPVFDGTWTIHERTIDGSDERAWAALVSSSPYTVDDVAEPARGSAFSMTSPMRDGSFLHASVTAGAVYQTIINKPNEFVLDFLAPRFGERVLIQPPGLTDEQFRSLGAEIERIWQASELRVEFE